AKTGILDSDGPTVAGNSLSGT
nr:RecName: Full=Granulitoxin; Short=GRX [Bunodosoma cangicum]